MLFVDLDRFKLVNDSLGHQAGDEFLSTIASRFARVIRSTGGSHTLARLGGDEFTVLLEDTRGDEEAMAIAAQLLGALTEPIAIGGQDVQGSASIGIASGTRGYSRAADVVRDADLAMYKAKRSGRGSIHAFDPVMHLNAVVRLRMEQDLRRALHERQFVLHYQPIVALGGNRLIGFEALIRWRTEAGTLAYPGDFIGIAEETGLIVFIGAWVLQEACIASARWNAGRPANDRLSVSVNVSSRQFQQPDLIDHVRAALAESGADPQTLRIELTESIAIEHTDHVVASLHALKALGVRISIDDFGTGYSSLSNLHRLPFDTLKIDRSFVQSMNEEGEGREIVRTILGLARNLRMDVIAEGTETMADVDTLRAMGCEYAQGYCFARPMDESAVASLLGSMNGEVRPVAA